MPLSTKKLRGKPLTDRPENLSRCGMSVAQYAQNCETKRWYELSENGKIIGSPLQLDFYTRIDETPKGSQPAEKQLAKT